jgi:hypothetical protein
VSTLASCGECEHDPRPGAFALPDDEDQQNPPPVKSDREKELPEPEDEPEGSN